MSKYQTSVASSATSLYELGGESFQNLIAGLSYGHIYPHVPEILNTMYNGLAMNLHQAYAYGRDTYTYGLPNGFEELVGDPDISAVEAAIAAEVGHAVQVHFILVSSPDDRQFTEKHAWENWGFKYGTGVLHNPPLAPNRGEHVTLYDQVFNPYGNLLVSLNIDDIAEPEIQNVLVPKEQLKPIPNQGKLYYHVRYTPVGATTPNHNYWIYEVGSGTHPSLDEVQYAPLDSPFLPIIPLRQDNTNLGPQVKDGKFVTDENGDKIRPDNERYRTSKELCRLLNTNYDDLCKDISSNPDVDDIDHAYLIFGIDIRATSLTGKDYLYRYFEDLIIKLPGQHTVVIQDANYKIDLRYTGGSRTVKSGPLGKPVEIVYQGNNIILRKDFKDGTYGEVTINGLLHTNYVYGNHAVQTDIADSADKDNYNFIIPVNMDIFNQTKGLFNKESILKESFKIVFNSYERRKLKWYETGIFQAFVLIVAIAITVWSVGTASAAINAAYAAGGIGAAISAAATIALTSLAVSAGVQWLVSQLPPELAIAVAVVLTVVSITMTVGDMSFDSMDAESMLQLTNVFYEGAQQSIQNEIQDVMSDINDFMLEAEAAEEELDALIAALDVSQDWFDEMIVDETTVTVIETPQDFYTRTIHTGNIGVATLSVIENYVDKSLELPELTRI